MTILENLKNKVKLNLIPVPDDGSCQGRLNCSDSEECKRYGTVGEPREMCECKAGTTRAFTYQGIRIVHALEFDEKEMRPPCVEPAQIGSLCFLSSSVRGQVSSSRTRFWTPPIVNSEVSIISDIWE